VAETEINPDPDPPPTLHYNAVMPRFADLSVSAFLDALASTEPTPGGGTAAAIAGAMGTSLLIMVAGLPKTRGNTDEERAVLEGVRTAIGPMRERFTALADADAEAFDEVMAAYRRPKATDEEKAARKGAIQDGLRRATSVPRDTMRVAAAVIAQAALIGRLGNPSASSDVGVAINLLEAAAAGAQANVQINLESITDPAFVADTNATLETMAATIAADLADARAHLGA
jgi:formiminotetrahydrofolate cyclodeaminase